MTSLADSAPTRRDHASRRITAGPCARSLFLVYVFCVYVFRLVNVSQHLCGVQKDVVVAYFLSDLFRVFFWFSCALSAFDSTFDRSDVVLLLFFFSSFHCINFFVLSLLLTPAFAILLIRRRNLFRRLFHAVWSSLIDHHDGLFSFVLFTFVLVCVCLSFQSLWLRTSQSCPYSFLTIRFSGSSFHFFTRNLLNWIYFISMLTFLSYTHQKNHPRNCAPTIKKSAAQLFLLLNSWQSLLLALTHHNHALTFVIITTSTSISRSFFFSFFLFGSHCRFFLEKKSALCPSYLDRLFVSMTTSTAVCPWSPSVTSRRLSNGHFLSWLGFSFVTRKELFDDVGLAVFL